MGVDRQPGKVIVLVNGGKERFTFKSFRNSDGEDFFHILQRLSRERRDSNAERTFEDVDEEDLLNQVDSEESNFVMNSYDWEVLRRGSKVKTFQPGQVIVTEGEHNTQIFVVIGGSCKAMTRDNCGDEVLLGTIREEETFGEISFLLGYDTPTTATVIAGESGVEVAAIDSTFLWDLWAMYPLVTAKFLRFLGSLLSTRLRKRTLALDRSGKENAMNFLDLTLYPKTMKGILWKKGTSLTSSWKSYYCEVRNGVFIIYRLREVTSYQV